jgi:hypothetical protein
MSLATFPLSPMPATMTRLANWNEDVNQYDSGQSQGFTNYAKPLYNYSINVALMTNIKASSLWTFFRDVTRGQVNPFLMKDPYDNAVNSVLAVASGVTQTTTLYLYDTNSYMVRADTTSISSLFSTLSGYQRLGIAYSYEQDTGILTVNTKAATDVWGVRSMSYWKKCRLASPYSEKSIIWNNFAADKIDIAEMP